MTAAWITTPAELKEFVASIEGAPMLALDSESDSFYHYHEKVCLLQLAAPGHEPVLLDSLAVRDLSALAPILEDPRVEKVLHGAEYDVTTLKRDFGFRFANLFDTMVASRFLGHTDFGLAATVRRELRIELSKGEQRADWSRRPLPEHQVRYAQEDVRHLPAVRDRLVEQLRAVGREHWAREESEALGDTPPAVTPREPADFFTAKGARDLNARGLGILRELYATREELASRLDRPRFKVIPDDVLMLLAQKRPDDEQELRRIPRCPASARRFAAELASAIRRGAALPEADLPAFARRPRDPVRPEWRRRTEAMKGWRQEAASRLGLEPGLLLPQRLIAVLAKEAPERREDLARVDGFRQWRVEAIGDGLLRVLGTGSPSPRS